MNKILLMLLAGLMMVSTLVGAANQVPSNDPYYEGVYSFTAVTNQGQWVRYDTRPGGIWFGRSITTDLFAEMENLCAALHNTSKCTVVTFNEILHPRRDLAPEGYFLPAPQEPSTVTATSVDDLLPQ